MVLRILASLGFLVSILYFPFWLSVILAFGMALYFSIFWEAVVLFLLSDLLFGVPGAGLGGATYISFTISALGLIALEYFKKKLKFYPK